MTADVVMKRLDGTETAVSGRAVADLRKRTTGAVVLPGEQGYETLREVWNGHIDNRPGAILRAADTDDVIAAVRFAREHELLISVRGGGHNSRGIAVADGGLMIDMQSQAGVRIDPVARRAYAQTGALLGDLDRQTQYFGLATPAGTVSDTGIAGLTLGGGFGWLSGHYGLTCDNVVSFELVDPDGELIRASAEENPDLFWALRGGGGNFGVVTQFEYRLYPVGLLYGGPLVFGEDKAPAFLRLWGDYILDCPDAFAGGVGFFPLPDGTRAFGGILSYAGEFSSGDFGEGEKALAEFRGIGGALIDGLGPIRYVDIQKINDLAAPPHRRYYAKSKMSKGIADGAIDAMVDRFTIAATESPESMIYMQSFGNAVGRIPVEDTAYAHRDAKVETIAFGNWTTPEGDDRNIAWARATAEALDPYSHGQYVNHTGLAEDEGAAGLDAAFGANWNRLLAVKQQYDPLNIFRYNQNIRPVATP